MADPEVLDKINEGVDIWNEWSKYYSGDMVDLSGAVLSGRSLAGIRFHNVDLCGADFTGSDLTNARFERSSFLGAIFSNALVSRANFYYVNLSDTILKSAKLMDATIGEVNFHNADLSGADLSRARVSHAGLEGANLSNTYLNGAIFSDVNLKNTDLSGSDLLGGAIYHSDLSGANFTKANLSSVTFNFSDIKLANMSESIFTSTIFIDSNLEDVKGLDTCTHRGPSFLELQTLQRSGRLPVAFLQGCGLTDHQINYLTELYNHPAEYYSCFISHSTMDKSFVEKLYTDLWSKGVRCWYAPESLQSGKKTHDQIFNAIWDHQKLLLVLSEESMKSKWVKTEIAEAREREEREGVSVLFPIGIVEFEEIKKWKYFDSDRGSSSSKEIREYDIPIFSNWKDNEEYEKVFNKLLEGLKIR